jgi:hypothetical protein
LLATCWTDACADINGSSHQHRAPSPSTRTNRGMCVRVFDRQNRLIYMAREGWPQQVEYVFTPEDRARQLADFVLLCRQMADAFAANGDPRAAELFRAKSSNAEQLLTEGFTQADLNEVGGEFPAGAWWLHPKALDYDNPREPWQDQIATWHEQAQSISGDLRAVAILRPS